jgi:hypothetical protein
MFFHKREESAASVARQDMLFLLTFGLLTMLLIALVYFNPPTEETTEEPPGDLIVTVDWPNDRNVDIDLWVKPPAGRAVGYSNLASPWFNLLRDDRGHIYDDSFANSEFGASRGIKAGAWVVNLHYYASRRSSREMAENESQEITARVTVSKLGAKGIVIQWLTKLVTLNKVGQELTIFRFRVDEEGEFVPGSEHNRCVLIRSKQTSGQPC